MPRRGFFFDITDDLENNANVHRNLVRRVEQVTKCNLLCYYANPSHPGGAIQDHDPDLLENILHSLNLGMYENRLDLLINSPGGFPYAAGKIVEVCRTFASRFRVIVINRAMSAATLVCMGADELIMTETASLGPIDPQVVRGSREGQRLVGAQVILESFKEMLTGAQRAIASNQPPDPFLHVLDSLDVTAVIESIKAKGATKSVAKSLLKSGLIKDGTDEGIDKIVTYFMAEGEKELHGKHLYAKDLQNSIGMPITVLNRKDKLDAFFRELLVRIEVYVGKKGIAKYLVTRQGGIDVSVQVRQLG
jgi:hypothetical protein